MREVWQYPLPTGRPHRFTGEGWCSIRQRARQRRRATLFAEPSQWPRTAGKVGHTPDRVFPSYYILGALQLAKADSARVGLAIEHTRDADDVVEPPRGGLPRLMTIEVRPEEVGPSGVKLDEASRAKLAAAGVDVVQVERELHGMRRGDKKLLGEVVYGAERDVPRPELEEQLRWYSIAPTEEEEERIARGETVTFLVGNDPPTA